VTLHRKTQLPAFSRRRLQEFADAGILHPTSTFKPKPKKATGKRQACTGPKKSVTELVDERSGGVCEWPDCGQRQTERHHRLNRKNGGRHGEAKERVNGVAWLLGACRPHHRRVTSPVGEVRKEALDKGWLLLEHQDATRVPVWTRHSDEPVYLTADGAWVPFQEACA
jgi:hypothetical protein